MTPSADYMANYREGGSVVRIADGRAMPIEGIEHLLMSFWSGEDWVQVGSFAECRSCSAPGM